MTSKESICLTAAFVLRAAGASAQPAVLRDILPASVANATTQQ